MAGHPALREFSPEVERIAKELGDTTLALPVGEGLWWPCEGPHWTHIYDAGCAICKASAAPYALRLVIERVLGLADSGAVITSPDPTGHTRYDSDEFDYSGCEKCDANGDTLGWPCPTISERVEEARSRTQVPARVEWTPIHEAVAHAVCCGPDGQDWLEARVFAVQVLEALRDEGHDVVPLQGALS